MKCVEDLGGRRARALSLAGRRAQAQVLFWSTQARPVEEAQKMREERAQGL